MEIATGAFGSMAGRAMIGQTMINVRVSGACTRLSTFAAGVFLLVLVAVFGGQVAQIPMSALVAVMIIVAVSTFTASLSTSALPASFVGPAED